MDLADPVAARRPEPEPEPEPGLDRGPGDCRGTPEPTTTTMKAGMRTSPGITMTMGMARPVGFGS